MNPHHTTAPCHICGTVPVDDGFCPICGMERRPPIRTMAVSGHLAALSDQGPRRRRNEDAYAIHSAGDTAALVVCDGVGGCPRGDAASRAASDAAVGVLAASLVEQPALDEESSIAVLTTAVDRAQAAVAALAGAGRRQPATTLVAALVVGDLVTVAHVGDSRAYWLADQGPSRCLTSDHSALVRSVRRRQGPVGGRRLALSCWLGADAISPAADITTFRVTGSGHLLLCSDGLWNPLSSAEHLSALVVPADPAASVSALADAALAAGTTDNVTVALAPVNDRGPSTRGGSS